MADVDDRWHVDKPRVGAAPCKEHALYPSAKHGKGKRWAARYRDDTGEQRSPLFDRKRDAENHLAKAITDLNAGAYVSAKAGRVKLAVHAARWLAQQTFDESTRESLEVRLRLHILPVLGACEVRLIKPATVQAWVKGMQGTLSASYVQVMLSNLSTILSAAVDDGLIARNPCSASSVRAPAPEKRRVVPWPAAWVTGVHEAMPARYREMVTVGAGIGLRQGEILGLSPDDVDWLRKVVHIRRQVKIVGNQLVFAPPKGGKERDVPLPDSVALRLSKHLQDTPSRAVTLPWRVPTGKPVTAALFFTHPTKGAINRTNYNVSAWKRALNAAGVPDTRENGMHALRHYFASVVLDGGANIKALAAWLGHTDPGFTLRVYTHLMPEGDDRMRKAVDGALAAGGAPDVRQAES